MSETDARHGTEAGCEQHVRDGEKPCTPCYEAKLRASRRRTKRKTMGYRYTVKIGNLHNVLTKWRDGGASYADISSHTGIEESQAWRLVMNGPDAEIRSLTYFKLSKAAASNPVTRHGITRRIQALQWLGYSCAVIAAESGVHLDTIQDARDTPQDFTMARTQAAICDAYDRLHMTIPEGATKQYRAGITRARNLARRRGWLPPLAWEDIDLGTTFTASRSKHVDDAVVERILGGDMTLARTANKAEKEEVVARWSQSLAELERLTGWNVTRYKKEVA